jgi:hypothetical protein
MANSEFDLENWAGMGCSEIPTQGAGSWTGAVTAEFNSVYELRP